MSSSGPKLTTAAASEDELEIRVDSVPPSSSPKTNLALPPSLSPSTATPREVEPLGQEEFTHLICAMQAHVDQYAPFTGRPLFLANLQAGTFSTEQPLAKRSQSQVFLNAIPDTVRPRYSCRTCRNVIDTFGDLCLVDETDGSLKPLLWPAEVTDVPAAFRGAVEAMRELFVDAEILSDYQITGTGKITIGRERTKNATWRHLHFTLTGARVVTNPSGILDLGTATRMLTRVLEEIDIKSVNTAHHLLHEKLPYATSHQPAIDWLQKLLIQLEGRVTNDAVGRRNLIKHHARDAWPGCLASLRGGIINQLLTLVRDGSPYSEIHDRWEALADSRNYLRPKGDPAIGNIEAAEKKVAEMGFTKEDFARYWLATDELPESAVLWKDTENWCAPNDSVLSDLKEDLVQAGTASQGDTVVSGPANDAPPPTTISFRSFARRVLPNTKTLELKLNEEETFCFITRGAPGRPSPFVFDSKNPENTMGWYYWGDDAAVSGANLRAGWNRVSGITTFPHMWDYLSPTEAVEWEKSAMASSSSEEEPKSNLDGKGGTGKWIHARRDVRFLFCLDGVKEMLPRELALFPVMLKNPFHAVRRTMEAFSRAGRIEWPHADEDGRKAQVGGLSGTKADWIAKLVRVTTTAGVVSEYEITLFD